MKLPEQYLKKLLKNLLCFFAFTIAFTCVIFLLGTIPSIASTPLISIIVVLLFLGQFVTAITSGISLFRCWRNKKSFSNDSSPENVSMATPEPVIPNALPSPLPSDTPTYEKPIHNSKACIRCGRSGIFLKLNTDGLCKSCATEVARSHSNLLHELEILEQTLSDKQKAYNELKEEAVRDALEQAQSSLQEIELQRSTAESELIEIQKKSQATCEEADKREKAAAAAIRKVARSKEIIKAIQHAVDLFSSDECSVTDIDNNPLLQEISDFLQPTVELDLQCLTMRDLRKRYRENEKHIAETLQRYEGRYTTKANAAIYKLMVIALRAELQNILYNIRFGKLEDALEDVKKVIAKYYAIAAEGNQSIAPTLKKFIGEIEYLFIEAVRTEYEYYVQKERAREEQRAIRDQMRQEAEERRELERQQKQIEKEESKYHDEISQLTEQLEQSADDEKTRLLQDRIAELQKQLSDVANQKERIANLQNGKAGNVYIISNIGSFGENVFKIGMTRRLEPQQRVDELGSASVPFPFDVHSMIFSNDAPALETRLHHILNDHRVNKVNLRKEFFNVTLDELESIVSEVAPTAEFKRTILAEQYRQSLSIDKVSENTAINEFDDDDDSSEDY